MERRHRQQVGVDDNEALERRRWQHRGIGDTEELEFFRRWQRGATNITGGMSKVGVLVVNRRAMLKAKDKLDEMNKEANEKKQKKNQEKAEKKEQAAIVAFHWWIDQGQKVDANGYPVLSKDSSVAIVKVVLSKIAPEEKLGDYCTMKACNK